MNADDQHSSSMNVTDLTTGNLWVKIFRFSIPLIITNLLQAIYNIADMMIVGHYVGKTGMSAVSNGGQVTAVVLCIVLGISNAGAVMVAQLTGAKRKNEVSKLMGTLMVTFIVIAIALTVIVSIGSVPILHWLNTPESAYDDTYSYLRICVMGTVFVYIYNFMRAVLNGSGNSKAPMVLIFISTCTNLVLDLLFVGVCSYGTAGAAFATLLSQIMSAVMIIVYTAKKTDLLDQGMNLFYVSVDYLKTLLKIGLPQSIQFSLTTLSFLCLAGLVNTYGVEASAAAGAVSKLSSFAVLPAQAVMGALITMTAQNIGAMQFDRALKGTKMGILYSLPLAMAFFLLSLLKPDFMLGLFVDDQSVINIGLRYLQILATSFLIEAIMFCLFGLLTGAGYTNITLICAIVSSFIVRYGLAKIFTLVTPLGFLGIAAAYPFAPIASTVICLCFIGSGKWKNSRIKV